MKNVFVCAVLCVLLCASCVSSFVSIVKTYGYYPSTVTAVIVKEVPAGAEYIGTIAVHPNDHTVFSGWNVERLYAKLRKSAAKAGARYVYIVNVEASGVDYWAYYYGDGYSVRAELYR